MTTAEQVHWRGKMISVRAKFLSLLCATFLILSSAQAQNSGLADQIDRLPWQTYPSVGSLGNIARVSLGDGLRFLGSSGTREFLELNGNPPRDNDYTLAPRDLSWFAVFAFDASGHVRDDEQLDSDKLLQILKQQNQKSVEERQRLRLPILRLQGWAVPPHYDLQTRRLEWGTRLIGDDGDVTVNYLVRILGRTGVMDGILVTSPANLAGDLQQFNAALRGFEYVPGERYSEFRQGDRMAEYGLAALVVGGGAAAAASSGMMKGIGKFVGLAVIAALAAVRGFFRKLFRKKTS